MTTFEAGDGSFGATARPVGEKRPGTAHPSGSEEASSAGALANNVGSGLHTTTRPPQGGTEPSPASSAATELVRATCRIQLDIPDLCATPELREAHRRRQCGEDCPACLASKTLRSARRDCARIANVALRLRWAADAELIDRYQVTQGRPPKGSEWQEFDLMPALERVTVGMPPAERDVLLQRCQRESGTGKRVLYSYPLLCRLAPNIAAGIVSAVEQAVLQKWSDVRWATLVQMDSAPPHYAWTNPIPLRKADVKLQHVEDKRFLLSFSVSSRGDSGRRGKEFSIPIHARDSYMMTTLTLLASDQSRMGALQISEDRQRPGRWYVRIAYRKLAQKTEHVAAAAINKGMMMFLAAATESGARWMHEGNDIVAYLKQVQARRRMYQRQVKVSARIGHGRTRTLRPIQHLQGQGEAWRDTRCQVIARRFVNWLVTEKVGRLYIDDFSGIREQPPEQLRGGETIWKLIQEWPFYKLQMKVISCCEENGIEVVIRNPKQISGTCPKCRSRNVLFDKRKLRCQDCKHAVHWDIAAAQVNLQDGESERRGDKAIEPKKSSKKSTKKKPPAAPSRKA